MSLFVLGAGCMLLAALAFLLVPLLRGQPANTARARLLPAAAVTIALPVLAVLLYAGLGENRWPTGDADSLPSVDEMVASLERRLEDEPRDLDGWLMLGRSYFMLQRYADAARAYGQAYELGDHNDPAVITAYAEALVLEDAAMLEGRAGELFDRALELAPSDPKALWYGGLAGWARGDFAVARDRWSRLRALGPPQAVDELLAQRLADIDRQSGIPQAAAAAAPAGAPASPAGPGVSLSIDVDPALRDRLEPGGTLYVIARAEGARGPPVAVVRRSAAELPLSLRLTDADTMLVGSSLSDHASLTLTARVSASGEPLPSSGDLFGESAWRSGQYGTVELTIDRVVP